MALRSRLAERAAARGTTVSELVREILERAVGNRPLGERIRRFRGSLTSQRGKDDAWSESIRARNWRS